MSGIPAVLVIDGAGIVRSWSSGAQQLLGIAAVDAVGRSLSSLVVPAELVGAHEVSLASLREGTSNEPLDHTISLPVRRSDGTTGVVEMTVTSFAVGDDEWCAGVLRDPDLDGVRADEVPPHEVLEELFERAPEIITLLDPNGRQRTINRAGVELMGFGAHGRFPGDASTFVHPDDVVRIGRAFVDQVADGGPGVPHRYRVLVGDGTWRWLETVFADMRDIRGIDGFVGFSRDVTDDAVRRIELATSAARLAAAVEVLAAAAIEDSEGRVAHHNAKFALTAGHEADADLRGFELEPLLHELVRGAVDAVAVEEELARCERSAATVRTGPLVQVDGRVLEVDSIAIVETDASAGRLWMVRDITDQIHAEERLHKLLALEQEARRLAEERTVLLDELARERLRFVSTVSHELRTPLASITSAVDYLLDVGDAPSDVLTSFLRLVGRNAERLARLVDDLLVVGRLDAGLISLVRVPVDVPTLLREVLLDLAPVMAPRSVSVALDLSEGPPLMADDLRLRQVVENLVGNAVKFGPQGGTVTVSCSAADGDWCIEVADEGPGLPVEERDKVFEPFARLPSADDHSIPGTGLGLAIVKGFVELHGGSVEVLDSAVGTRIRCRLPIG